jgi:phosphoserine phosphatase
MSDKINKIFIFDIESTLTPIEGLDFIANSKGEEIAEKVKNLTSQGMSGANFADGLLARLALIKPSQIDLDTLRELYIKNITSGAKELIQFLLSKDNTRVILVSGGITELLADFADEIGISNHCDQLYAVSLGDICARGASSGEKVEKYFEIEPSILEAFAKAGNANNPIFDNDGKKKMAKIIREKEGDSNEAIKIFAIGDGVTDSRMGELGNAKFIAYTEFCARDKAVAVADHVASSMKELQEIIEGYYE